MKDLTLKTRITVTIVGIAIAYLIGRAIWYGMKAEPVKQETAPIDMITEINKKIDVKEHEKAANKKKYAEAEAIIQQQKERQAMAESGNNQINAEIEALQNTKEEIISGK